MELTIRQKQELNEIYTNIKKKYSGRSSDTNTVMTMTDARAIARYNLMRSRKGFQWRVTKCVYDALVRKIYQDAKRSEAATRSRSMRDFDSRGNFLIKEGIMPQSAIDNELYDAYMGWLLQYPATDAYNYLVDNPLFLANMGDTKFTQLKTVMNARRNT